MQNTVEFQTQAPPLSIPLGGFVHRAWPYAQNLFTSYQNKSAIQLARSQCADLKTQFSILADSMTPQNSPRIPPILHFVYLSKTPAVFLYYAKLAVLSALHYNIGWKAIFHLTHEPTGPHWESIKSQIILNRVPDLQYFGIAPLHHYAHKADVIRLLALDKIGGAYLDLDTLTQRSFEPLQNEEFVMGVQASLPGQPGGLCNAIMLAAPNSEFAKLWLLQFRHFRSRGTDWLWDYLSVKTPAILARKHPDLVTVLKPDAFFNPLWDKIDKALFSETPTNFNYRNFAFHLWNNAIANRLGAIDANYVKTSNSLYAQIARPVAKAAGDI